MEILQLRLFASIARTLNFSATAKQYFITQPTVSMHIKKMEDELGVKLINRSSHEVSLTAEGSEYLKYVSQILVIHETAETRIRNITHGQSGHIRIAAISSASFQFCDCLIKLYEKYPQIQVDIDLLGGSEIVEALQQGNHDFYFAGQPMVPVNAGFTYSITQRRAVELFVNKSIAHTIDMDDWSTIERHPFVTIPQNEDTLSGLTKQICRNRKIEPRIVNYYNRAEAIVLSVNAGIGVSILPGELSLLYQMPNVVTFPISGDDAVMTTVFVWKGEIQSTAAKIFKDIVLSAYPPDAASGVDR